MLDIKTKTRFVFMKKEEKIKYIKMDFFHLKNLFYLSAR